MIRRPPRSTRTDTLFPYTTLFLSDSGTVQAIPSPPASLAIHSNDNDGAHRGDWRQISAVPVRQRSEQLGIFDSPPGNGYLSTPPAPMRSEARRVGKECVSTCRSRGSRCIEKRKHRKH